MPRTVVHVGAHKTATTYIQKKLALNIGLLASRGIRYDALEALRKTFTPLINGSGREDMDFIRGLADSVAAQDVIISDENLLGMAGEVVRKGNFYPDARERLLTALGALGAKKPVIFLAVREYSAFVVSMYCEYLRHQQFIPFERYMAAFKASGFNWIDVVGNIFAAAPDAELHAWRFDDFRARESDILSAMVGFDSAELAPLEGSARESFSETMMRAYEALNGVLSPKDQRKLLEPLQRSFPKGADYPAYQPIPEKLRLSYRDSFEKDVQKLRKKYPQVQFFD